MKRTKRPKPSRVRPESGNAIDLTARAPRPCGAKLGGLVMLARTIDKARAKLNGTLGPYKISPGLSGYLLEWLGISEADFLEAVRRSSSDDEVVAWVRAHSDPSSYAEINRKFEERRIRGEEHLKEFLPRYPILERRPELRTKTWFEILEADDAEMFSASGAASDASSGNSGTRT